MKSISDPSDDDGDEELIYASKGRVERRLQWKRSLK